MQAKAEAIERQPRLLVGQLVTVQYPQHRIFTKDARHDGDPKVNRARLSDDLEAAVLRYASFGNIEFRNDLDA